MRRHRKQQGMVVWLVAVIAAFSALALSNLTLLSHGEIRLLSRSEQGVRCELAARSVFHQMTADLRLLPWSRRPCARGPVHRSGSFPDGVAWDAVLQDARGREQSVDLWISTRYDQAARAVFHRVDVRMSLFQKMNDLAPVCFSFLDAEQYGKPESVDRAIESVAAVLSARDAKRDARQRAGAELQKAASLSEVLDGLELPRPAGLLEQQTALAPGARAGYSRPPLQLALASFAPASLAAAGAMRVEDFQTVSESYRVDADLEARIRHHLGGERAARVLGTIEKLQLDPDSGRRILRELSADKLGGGISETEARIIQALADRVTDAREGVIWGGGPLGGPAGEELEQRLRGQVEGGSGDDRPAAAGGDELPAAGSAGGMSLVTLPGGAGLPGGGNSSGGAAASGQANAGGPDAPGGGGSGAERPGNGIGHGFGLSNNSGRPAGTPDAGASTGRRYGNPLQRWARGLEARVAGWNLNRKIERGTATEADVRRFEEKFGAYESVSRKGVVFDAAVNLKDRLMEKAQGFFAARRPKAEAGTATQTEGAGGSRPVSNETPIRR